MGSQRIASVKSVDNGPWTAQYYHSDHLGSSNIITDEQGNQIALYEYTPYGELATTQQTGGSTNYLFTGKELDASTGLYFYGARYYDAEIGRFITPDTIVQAPSDPQSLNRYAYCRNNPVKYVDPSGHGWFSKFFAKNAGVIGLLFGFTGLVIGSIITGNWEPTKNIAISTGSAFLFSGFNPVAAAGAFIASSILETQPGREYVQWQGEQVFDDVFGMRPKAAYMWSYIATDIALTLTFEAMVASLVAEPVAGQRPYDPSNKTDKALTDNPKGYDPYGRMPGRNAHPDGKFTNKELTTLYDKNGNSLAVVGKAPKSGGLTRLGLESRHTGAITRDFPNSGILKKFPEWGYATVFGTCHQATNATFLASGISDTVLSLYSHWSIFTSTVIYGNYGGGLMRSMATGIQANQNYTGD
ncbi:MAG: RHS repeat-associated core domain-containing protein [Candidatus Omnitrophica bacterium]|nr:RHS repeat-associated core domain-containing protein [Candidatus Omnitrophota bacterium]